MTQMPSCVVVHEGTLRLAAARKVDGSVEEVSLGTAPAFASAVESKDTVIAMRIANVVLHVADELIGPVEEIDGAVRRHADGRRAEVRVVRFDQIFDGLALQPGTLLAHLYAEDALEPNDVAVEEVALEFLGKMAARQNGRASAGP